MKSVDEHITLYLQNPFYRKLVKWAGNPNKVVSLRTRLFVENVMREIAGEEPIPIH